MMHRQGEEELEYDSGSAPSTPRNSEVNDDKKKKKRGFKKIFSMKKSADKPPSSPDRGLVKEEGDGGSDSRRMSLPGFLKFGGRTSKNDESKSTESQSYNDKTSQTLLENEMHAKDSLAEAPKEDAKLSKVDTLAEKIGGKTITLLERVKEDIHKHIHKSPKESTVDDNGKPKEHQETKGVANPGQGNDVVKHDGQHHREQNEYFIGDVKEEKLPITESEGVAEDGRDMSSPPPPPLQEKESVGCESLAQGLQNVCLPWTVKKEDH